MRPKIIKLLEKVIPYMWTLKRNGTDEFTKQRLTDLENKLKVACGKEQLGSLGWTCLLCCYLKWITNRDLLYGTCSSAQYCVTERMAGGSGGEWIPVHIQSSPFPVRLKLSQHCSSAIPQYKIRSLKKEKGKKESKQQAP